MAPGEGALASVLLGARKDLKPTIVGKPYQPLLDVVQRALDFDPKKTIFVGDRYVGVGVLARCFCSDQAFAS